MNELLLTASVIAIFSAVLLFFRLFGKTGLFVITAIATITANIEVLILINAFGIEQTLGNVLFAATFLCTDIASELYGEKTANQIVNIGILTSLLFIILTQSWLTYTPSPNDFIFPSIRSVFSHTPRLMIVGLIVYALSQKFDVWVYQTIWRWSDARYGAHRNYLWLRNNGSTLLSQLINSILFTVGAFYGVYPLATLCSILWASYLIYMLLAIADTGFVYLARRMYETDNYANHHD